MRTKNIKSQILRRKFKKIYLTNAFRGNVSLSGRGSDYDQTRIIESQIPQLFQKFKITSILDVPCGDHNWMQRVEIGNANYVGADIVDEIVKFNLMTYGDKRRNFIQMDITDQIPSTFDLILCRDLFVHLKTRSIFKALNNIKKSKSRYLLTTTFTNARDYQDLRFFSRGVGWRPINLQLPPFNFPAPLLTINEGCTEENGVFSDKTLALWEIAKL